MNESDVSGMTGSEAGESVVPVGQCTNRASVLLLNDILIDIETIGDGYATTTIETIGDGFATTTNNSDGFVASDGVVTSATNTGDGLMEHCEEDRMETNLIEINDVTVVSDDDNDAFGDKDSDAHK
jgi:hypothetical protein